MDEILSEKVKCFAATEKCLKKAVSNKNQQEVYKNFDKCVDEHL